MSTTTPPITIERFTELAHRTASRYSHRSEPSKVAYTFLPHTLEHFHHLVCAAIGANAQPPVQTEPDYAKDCVSLAVEALEYHQAQTRPIAMTTTTLALLRTFLHEAATQPEPTPPTTEQIDTHLDAILRAAGSGLRHYTMQKALDDMRAAMRKAITGDPT